MSALQRATDFNYSSIDSQDDALGYQLAFILGLPKMAMT
jgi:hypothetical protein